MGHEFGTGLLVEDVRVEAELGLLGLVWEFGPAVTIHWLGHRVLLRRT